MLRFIFVIFRTSFPHLLSYAFIKHVEYLKYLFLPSEWMIKSENFQISSGLRLAVNFVCGNQELLSGKFLIYFGIKDPPEIWTPAMNYIDQHSFSAAHYYRHEFCQTLDHC